MIYIVEDDASIRELEQYALQSNGYEVQGFESAEPFWQAMRTAEPELVILDVMLPGEDGFSILNQFNVTLKFLRLRPLRGEFRQLMGIKTRQVAALLLGKAHGVHSAPCYPRFNNHNP